MEEIKAGDVVYLKSGGPGMTVEWTEDKPSGKNAYCVWFEGKEAKHSMFYVHALQKNPPPDM